jgi:hypothetical protein
MKKLSAVLVSLQNPREKVWGILLSIQAAGITVKGIDLNSFDDWSRSVAKGEGDMGLSTMFFPVHRVERVNKDETVGRVPSLAEVFAERVGRDVWGYLGLGTPLPEGETKPPDAGGSGEEWLTLREAERDYIERVLSDCEWDTAVAARLLDVSPDTLKSRMREHGLDVASESSSESDLDAGRDSP